MSCNTVRFTMNSKSCFRNFLCKLICLKFKVYSMMIWYTYILQNDYHNKVNASIPHISYVLITFKICLNSFQKHITVLLIIITILYINSQNLVILYMEVLFLFFAIFLSLLFLAILLCLGLLLQC